ncbi:MULTISPECIES: HAD family hydrolase [Actinosynnema]|uniref:HAD family hydrolase n=1 Tax=Actinosynnema TaxID=40566 RepID=UPI0020A584BF|nr:HAD family hydrolase [Actinosynnema pretiosum]MCP2099019.1 haloacid dehalogenase superfamily, subfamily IA, variant 1 with third motif having Dx(3-4)D or Dx(3-4)E [Actinosynnema pretiosum]
MDNDSPFDAVLFDFSGTLFDDTGVLDARGLAARTGLPEPEAATTLSRVLAHVDAPASLQARKGGDLSVDAHRAVWTALIAEAGPFPDTVVEAVYAGLTDPAGWRPYPDALPVLTELRARGLRLGVLSNIGWDLRPALAAAGVLELLDVVVLSCEHGMEKPDPALFAVARAELPGRVLYVGDDPVKDGAAVRAGMPVYLLPHERSVDRPRGLSALLRLTA